MESRKRDRSPQGAARTCTSNAIASSTASTAPATFTDLSHEEPAVDQHAEENHVLPSTSEPSPLISFFQQQLPLLVKNPLHTSSTSTRNPRFYDMHIAKKLRLKRIVFLEDLLQQLSKICDKYIQDASSRGKDRSSSFPGLQIPPHNNITDENRLLSYFTTLHKQYSLIASGLLFETDWSAVFAFSSQGEGMTPPTHGAADAYLFIREGVEPLISEQAQSEVDLIRKYNLDNFVIWEYKNLGFGSQVFAALRTQEGDFHWATCQERVARDEASTGCCLQLHRVDGRPVVTGRRTGPDAVDTEGIIKRSTAAKVLDNGDERPSKRVRIDEDSSKHHKVHSILQQSWTSAVVQDATFIVISSGNEECIGIRHRESQTLFVSPPIRPSDERGPAFLKVCIAMYIVAYQDAASRAAQLESGSLSLFAQSTLRLRIDKQPDLVNVSSSCLFQRFPVEVELPILDSEIVEILQTTPQMDLRLHRHVLATTQYNAHTWTLSRCLRPRGGGDQVEERTKFVMPRLGSSRSSSDGFLVLDLDYLIDKTSRIYRVYFGISQSATDEIAYLSRPLIVKMSRDDKEGDDLQIEYDNYRKLHASGVKGIVKCYGLFLCQVNSQESRYFLLLEDGGTPISKRTLSCRLAHTKKYRKVYKEALRTFHRNGYTHNNITTEHVLMDMTLGEAKLISLKNIGMPEWTDFASRKAKDISVMGLCLGAAPERGNPGEETTSTSVKENKGKGGSSSSSTSRRKETHPARVVLSPFDVHVDVSSRI